MSTVVQAEVAGRSAGIDCRRGFDPIDCSISVDSRAVFGSLIQVFESERCGQDDGKRIKARGRIGLC